MQNGKIKPLGMKLKKFIPQLPVRKTFHYKGLCPNCEHEIDGKFCQNCGQSAKDFHRPFFSILFESLSDALSFDNRLFHTLSPLLLKPGYLTKEFMKGRRARYTPPFRLYLFLTFFAFLLLSFNHTPDRNFTEKMSLSDDQGKQFDLKKMVNGFIPASDSTGIFTIKTENAIPLVQDSIKGEGNLELDLFEGHIGDFLEMWKLNPSLMMDTALKKLSQTLLIILPIFALFLAFFYIRQRRYLLEHLLISLNFHSFIFIIVILSELLLLTNIVMLEEIAMYLYFSIPIQLFFTLKTYYGQGWRKTTFKFMTLSFFYNLFFIAGLLIGFILMTQS
tara:strand:- start:26054 stop:27052 length:999 start_codon:yes stop_codon:yes gene_type:complete